MYQKKDYKKQPKRKSGKNTTKNPSTQTRDLIILSEAVNAVIAFAKSDAEEPPRQFIDAVNRYLKPMTSGKKHKTMETIVSHRTLMVGKLSIKTLRELDDQQHEKADKALFDIANTYVRIRKIGSDHVADIAHNGHTTSVTIDQSTAKDFRKGLLSIDNLLNMSDS